MINQHINPNIDAINIKNRTAKEKDIANSLVNPIIKNKNMNTASLVPMPDIDIGIIANKLDIAKQIIT